MSRPSLASTDQDMDQEVNDLLTFLNDFKIVPPSAKKAVTSSPYPRRPLGTLQQLSNNRIVLDTKNYSQNRKGGGEEEEEESSTTTISILNDGMNRHSWAIRMSQALRDWKDNHERLAERRLLDQRKQLQKEHEQEMDKLRKELHEYYQNKFQVWKDEYLSSYHPQAKHVDEWDETPKTNRILDRCVHDNVFAESIIRKDSGGKSFRQKWKSPDGKEVVHYGNGTRREKNSDGSTITRFPNGDLQTTGSSDGSPTKLCYFYGSSGTLRMDQTDGSVIFIYPSGQRERHFPDGTVEVLQWAS